MKVAYRSGGIGGRTAARFPIWSSSGGKLASPPVCAPGKSSYGTCTIQDLIPYEFGGTVDLVFAAEGVRCRLELPPGWLTNAAEPTEIVADTAR